MQLSDLVKPIDQMTDDELLVYLREIRHRQQVVRPAAAKRVERTEKKESRAKTNKLGKLVAGLSEEEKLALLKALETGE